MWDDIDRDEKIRLIRHYIKQDYSASQIAQAIGGCTRNSVIGLCHRAKIQLSTRPAPDDVARVKAPKPKAKRIPKAPKVKPPAPEKDLDLTELMHEQPKPVEVVKIEPVTEIPNNAIHLLKLNLHTCRWPLWDSAAWPTGDELMFCGCHVATGSSYCEAHSRKATQQVQRRAA